MNYGKLDKCPNVPAKVLVVILHSMFRSGSQVDDLVWTTKEAFESEGVDLYRPTLPYAHWWKSIRLNDIVSKLIEDIDEIYSQPNSYERVVLVGFCLGGIVIRRLFLSASPSPPDFTDELRASERNEEVGHAWASAVDRIITISPLNRGWQISRRSSWKYSLLFNVMGLIGHLTPRDDWTPTIFDARHGAPFIVQTRLHWLRYRAWHYITRNHDITRNVQPLRAHSGTPPRGADPIVIQLMGTRDDLVSPEDQVDIAVDDQDRLSLNHPANKFFLIQMANTDHEATIVLRGDSAIRMARMARFKAALKEPPASLAGIAMQPKLLSDEPIERRPGVKDVVFVLHGIRDDGFWTHRIAEAIKSRLPQAEIHSRAPTYGYFAMLPFLLPWVRRQKREWFMDHYVNAKAEFPDAEISYVGHSNGTYLAAAALRDYPACKFKHIYFAGSVVPTDYDWDKIANGRVTKVYNVVGATDWVVALAPKCFDRIRKIDLGGAGFDGFKLPSSVLVQSKTFATRGHGGAIQEGHWPLIAEFIRTGKKPDEPSNLLEPLKSLFVSDRHKWLVRLSELRIGKLGIGIPVVLCLAMAPLPWLVYRLIHPGAGVSVLTAALYTSAIFVYLAFLRFVITRF